MVLARHINFQNQSSKLSFANKILSNISTVDRVLSSGLTLLIITGNEIFLYIFFMENMR